MLGAEDTSYAVDQWLFLGYGRRDLWQSCIANVLVDILAFQFIGDASETEA